MRKLAPTFAGLALALGVTATVIADDVKPTQAPRKEHQWLAQLEGTWDVTGQCVMDPKAAPKNVIGTECSKAIGGYWAVCKFEGRIDGQQQGKEVTNEKVAGAGQGMQFCGFMTIGFDVKSEKFIATWIDSTSNHMWRYEGELDDAGKVLTLEGEGPCPETGEEVKVREIIELRGTDQRVFRSQREKDGSWVDGLTLNYTKVAAGAKPKYCGPDCQDARCHGGKDRTGANQDQPMNQQRDANGNLTPLPPSTNPQKR